MPLFHRLPGWPVAGTTASSTITEAAKNDPKMIDTHTHIYLEEFDDDRDEVVRRAREAGVERVILPNVDLTTVTSMQATHNLYPGYCRMAMGLHLPRSKPITANSSTVRMRCCSPATIAPWAR